jgi:hypothetical protein
VGLGPVDESSREDSWAWVLWTSLHGRTRGLGSCGRAESRWGGWRLEAASREGLAVSAVAWLRGVRRRSADPWPHNGVVSDQSSTFPVFNARVEPEQTVDRDPLHIADRSPDEIERAVAEDRLPDLAPCPPDSTYVLTPGEDVTLVSGHVHRESRMILLNSSGLTLINGADHLCCATPGSPDWHTSSLPRVNKLVWVDVERRPVGYLSRGDHFVVAENESDEVIYRVDTSNVLSPFQPDCLEQLCRLAGADFELVTAHDIENLLETRPELVPPRLEFEVDHPNQETVEEVALGIGLVVPLSFVLGGVGMVAFALSPFAVAYRLLGVAGVLVASAISAWSLSERRKRRSVAKPNPSAMPPSS